MKKIILAANWKLNKSPAETRAFFQSFIKNLSANSSIYAQIGNHYDVVFFPSAISLEACAQSLKETSIGWGGQNIYSESQGAFTGENSAKVIKELGGHYALIGHSERRQYFNETNSILNKKINHALQSGLVPIYCIGETLNERETNQTERVLLTQLADGLKDISGVSASSLVVAYEPVWAIGTGKIATADQVKETHAFIQKTLSNMGLSHVAILYGGSVKASNAKELVQIPNVSGFLVGGASLEPQSFLELIVNSISF